MIPVIFVRTTGEESIKSFVQTIPRNGELVSFRIGGVQIKMQVAEVTHIPALNLTTFPLVSITLKTLTAQDLQNYQVEKEKFT